MSRESNMKKFITAFIVTIVTTIIMTFGAFAADFMTWDTETVLASINTIRETHGMEALSYQGEMQEAADTRAKEASICWSHTRPDGRAFWTADADYVWGENLAKGYSDPKQIVTAWMNSDTHRALILTGGFKTACIGWYRDKNNNVFCALEFGI